MSRSKVFVGSRTKWIIKLSFRNKFQKCAKNHHQQQQQQQMNSTILLLLTISFCCKSLNKINLNFEIRLFGDDTLLILFTVLNLDVTFWFMQPIECNRLMIINSFGKIFISLDLFVWFLFINTLNLFTQQNMHSIHKTILWRRWLYVLSKPRDKFTTSLSNKLHSFNDTNLLLGSIQQYIHSNSFL
jgi:hypothetical protein